jgi:hypothetical protein
MAIPKATGTSTTGSIFTYCFLVGRVFATGSTDRKEAARKGLVMPADEQGDGADQEPEATEGVGGPCQRHRVSAGRRLSANSAPAFMTVMAAGVLWLSLRRPVQAVAWASKQDRSTLRALWRAWDGNPVSVANRR